MTTVSPKKVKELVLTIIELRAALALERGGGTPLSNKAYLDLDSRAKKAIDTELTEE